MENMIFRAVKNITNFYNPQGKVIQLYKEDYMMMYNALYDETYEKGLKILTFLQMLQRLLIALALVKADYTSENYFLN